MANYAYTTVPGKIKGFFEKLRTVGVPQKATVEWLASIGYKSSNDRTLLKVLKFLSFCDSKGIPTKRWTEYRGANCGKVLATAIREAYQKLFYTYDDAHLRTDQELESYFSTRMGVGKEAVSKAVSTFKHLCELAEFDTTTRPEGSEPVPTGPMPRQAWKPSLHIDIQIHLSPDVTAEQLDLLLASMAKHLGMRGDD